VLLLLDCSGSMGGVMSTGQRRIDALRAIVNDVLADVVVPMASFGPSNGEIVLAVPEPGGSTPLAEAIQFARTCEKDHLVVISDGEPDSEVAALDQASQFGGKIDAIFVGPEGSRGADFMRRLAALTGGSGEVQDLRDQRLLTDTIKGFLGAGA
jgi:Mg-chelatase subunit ChlD